MDGKNGLRAILRLFDGNPGITCFGALGGQQPESRFVSWRVETCRRRGAVSGEELEPGRPGVKIQSRHIRDNDGGVRTQVPGIFASENGAVGSGPVSIS